MCSNIDRRFGILPNELNSLSKQVTDCEFSVDGSTILSVSYDGAVCVWNWKEGTCITRMMHTLPVTCCSYFPDDTHIIAGAGSILYVWDIKAGKCGATFEGYSRDVCA